jgi:hypothetical protein
MNNRVGRDASAPGYELMMLQQLSDDTFAPETFSWPAVGVAWAFALITVPLLFLVAFP